MRWRIRTKNKVSIRNVTISSLRLSANSTPIMYIDACIISKVQHVDLPPGLVLVKSWSLPVGKGHASSSVHSKKIYETSIVPSRNWTDVSVGAIALSTSEPVLKTMATTALVSPSPTNLCYYIARTDDEGKIWLTSEYPTNFWTEG